MITHPGGKIQQRFSPGNPKASSEYIKRINFILLPAPQYSPDVAPNNFSYSAP
jgi:hypothetical protein